MLGTIEMTRPTATRGGDVVLLTPEMATQLLEHNTLNRPLSDAHVQRLTRQITEGKWRFNGDTIKIAETGDVLDGQHRLWAVIEARTPVETILVSGIAKEAFATIDTLRKPRSGGDVVALSGQVRYRNQVSGALSWLVRWQRGILENYKEPINRVENSDIEEAFAAHEKGIVRAVERAMTIRKVANPSIMAFVYYVGANQNMELAEQMMASLDNPGRLPQTHPFFQLRAYFTNSVSKKPKDPLVTIALSFKALNAAHFNKAVQNLMWKSQGSRPEPFPILHLNEKKAAA